MFDGQLGFRAAERRGAAAVSLFPTAFAGRRAGGRGENRRQCPAALPGRGVAAWQRALGPIGRRPGARRAWKSWPARPFRPEQLIEAWLARLAGALPAMAERPTFGRATPPRRRAGRPRSMHPPSGPRAAGEALSVIRTTAPLPSLCLTAFPPIAYPEGVPCGAWVLSRCNTGTGKLVQIQHGPATVIGDESRSVGHCPLRGWEGRGK